jgi:hypothetical protein
MIKKVFKACHDINGEVSRKKVALAAAIVGFTVAILVVIVGIFKEIKSPSVVIDITISIVGAPFLMFISSYFGRRNKDVKTPME